jgi:uncharacterized membrane protein required for colicin V production
MGLDLALGGLVLVMAIRGWIKGFVLQAIRLVGVVVCVYAADPVRDQVKPRVIGYLPTIQPELVDRMLWWSSAVATYVLLVGVATLAVKLYRRHPYGLVEPSRADQFGGLLLGGTKGVVVAALLVAGIQNYALDHLKGVPRAQEQVRTSRSMQWNERYKPVARVLATMPVQHFVNHVRRMGRNAPAEAAKDAAPVQTASRTPKLEWPGPGVEAEAPATEIDREVVEAVEAMHEELRKLEAAK